MSFARRTRLVARQGFAPRTARMSRGAAQMTRGQIIRGTSKPIRAKKAMRRRGPKTAEWEMVRAQLKVEFEKRGITECELGIDGCWKDDSLGFAHSRKRTDPLFNIWEVILACSANCHDVIERKSHADMYQAVMEVIEKRGGLILPEAGGV